MASRLGQRVVYFPNLPIKLILPQPPFSCIHEFAIKTLPSASKIEIRRVLESLYGFDIAEVRTLNYEGKKMRRGFYLASKPDYKKAYVTLKNPLAVSPELFPIGVVRESLERKVKKSGSEVVGSEEKGKHWLDERKDEELSYAAARKGYYRGGKRLRDVGGVKNEGKKEMMDGDAEKRFPWSGMRIWGKGKQ